ncbi:phytoene/squalene synthase family protein [Zhouia spongiae]|uniref:Phytoene/squalene synthase family protein n=1 Tax=Zhouia spongiae TaxID=2202721 RepID=A0ABY3YHU5_9FLAO|nr:phytoene/squalene synthase family protein [Zhouia spongiae]UNY97425.1 phytoene/squalene synthase family protein [Zhouia spongiae]
MKALFDTVSYACSKQVTQTYSTSFSLAVKMLAPSIRQDIYNIYGFVRFADEIVDSFHSYDKESLFNRFETDLNKALENRISLNPILNAFQHTVHKYNIGYKLIDAFMNSMRLDLTKQTYNHRQEYNAYIYGSADVVGLMCLKVFVKGNEDKYNRLKDAAQSLGSAFQKVNFLRDLKEDTEILNRSYFPEANNSFNNIVKNGIIEEIEVDFLKAYKGILLLPKEAKFGVYTAYRYYKKLLDKLKKAPVTQIQSGRIRVPNYQKFGLLAKSYVNYKLNLF